MKFSCIISTSTEFSISPKVKDNCNQVLDKLVCSQNFLSFDTNGRKPKELVSIGSVCICKELDVTITRQVDIKTSFS